ncbi:MAG TPA: S8 family peptidase [Actinoplanes sp.]|nr:S8 family peptidase [Actinoplanes sp.]
MRPVSRSAAVLVGTGIALSLTTPAFATPATGEVKYADSATAVAGSYVVVLKSDVDQARADRITKRYGGTVSRVFGHAVEGYSARLTAKQAARLAADPAVASVEADQVVRIAATQSNAPWGLDRIDQRNLPLSTTYTYGASSGVTVYVVDTGITVGHTQFGGRASYGYDAVDNDNVAQDGNGHGTFVAGVAVGSTYGVAKSANVVGVRVLNNSGSGTTAGVIAGIDWVTANATPGRSVGNLSLGGGASSTLDAAVRRAITAGIPFTIAAGNSGVNASNTSPARIPEPPALHRFLTSRHQGPGAAQPSSSGTFWNSCTVKVIISRSIQLPVSNSTAPIAAAFGTKERVDSWIWVTDWNSEMTKPTPRAVSRTGADIFAATVIDMKATSMTCASDIAIPLRSDVSRPGEAQPRKTSIRPGPQPPTARAHPG